MVLKILPDNKILNGATIKITNLSDPTDVFTISPNFTIRGGFMWDYPNVLGQAFKVNTTEVLRWTTFGTIPVVDIEYSTNDGFSSGSLIVVLSLGGTSFLVFSSTLLQKF